MSLFRQQTLTVLNCLTHVSYEVGLLAFDGCVFITRREIGWAGCPSMVVRRCEHLCSH